MINELKVNKLLLLSVVFFSVVVSYAIWFENWILLLSPIALIFIYLLIFYQETLFLSLFFFTPLSINIDEFSDSFGLFLPTEPLLLGLTFVLLAKHLYKKTLSNELIKSPLFWISIIYLIVLILSSITSSLPLVSFKSILSKIWFIVPVFYFGVNLFSDKMNIIKMLWLFSIGMTISMLYTLIIHASYSFGEVEGHWVMSPLFKDHTIYGALVALVLPLNIALLKYKKHNLLIQLVLFFILFINLVALYFSYTRAAWLSIVFALGVYAVIKLKIKFKYIAIVIAIAALITASFWTQIQFALERNNAEHTTEEFGERLESMSNITSDASNLERLNRWDCAIQMFLERPILGFGPNTYAFEYARFQRPENLTIISTNFGDGGNAHSEYLGPLAETGIIGFLSVISIIAALFYTGIMLYIKTADSQIKVFSLAFILALSTYFFHGILNNYWDTDKASMPIWAAAAIFVAHSSKIKSNKF